MTKTKVCEALERAAAYREKADPKEAVLLRTLKERIERGRKGTRGINPNEEGWYEGSIRTLTIDWSGREGEVG